MRYTATPGVTPTRATTYEAAARKDTIGEHSESEAKHLIEGLNRKRRGYEVATAEVNLRTAQANHLQAHIKLGIANLNTEIAREDFKRTAWGLVGKKAQTAIAEDNARGTVSEHGFNQTTIRERLTTMELNTVEATVKNQDRRSELTLNGTLPRFRLGNG